MSRSYHVTKRAAVRAFILDGDTDLTAEGSDKAGIKRRERAQRSCEALGLKRQPRASEPAVAVRRTERRPGSTAPRHLGALQGRERLSVAHRARTLPRIVSPRWGFG